jgi:hypothetical protein
MAKFSPEQVIKRHNSASSIKSSWDDKYSEVFKYTMPQRDGYEGNSDSQYDDRRDTLFTSVGESSADEFVNTMQMELCPPQADWLKLEAGEAYGEEKEKENHALSQYSKIANEYKNNSSFDIAFSEFCYDLTAGTACMLVTAGTVDKPLVFKAISLKDYCIEEGIHSEVRSVYRQFNIKRELVPHQWRELEGKNFTSGLDGDASKESMEIIESCIYDYEDKVFRYQVIDKKERKELLNRVHKSNPFIVLRWNKTAGEVYGRGVGIKALADIKTLNKVKEYSLRALAFSIPTFLAQQDASVDYDEFLLEPGALNVVPSTQLNNPSIAPLQVNNNIDIEQFHMDNLAMDIKGAMYANTLPTEPTGEMTAYEVATRESTLNKNLTSVYGRLIGEFVNPVHRRIFEILDSLGLLPVEDMVERIDGYWIKAKVNSSLYNKLKMAEAGKIVNAVQMLFGVDPTGQVVQQSLKTDTLLPYLLGIMSVPEEFISTTDEINSAKAMQAITQRQQQVQGMKDEALLEGAKAEQKSQYEKR